MGEQEEDDATGGSITKITLIVVSAVIVTPFVPLMLAGIEYLMIGTHEVENFCRTIGNHDELDALYNAAGSLFR